MATYAADPRFDAFNALLPSRHSRLTGAKSFQLDDVPVSAMVSQQYNDTKTSGIGEKEVSPASEEAGLCIIDDETRESLVNDSRR